MAKIKVNYNNDNSTNINAPSDQHNIIRNNNQNNLFFEHQSPFLKKGFYKTLGLIGIFIIMVYSYKNNNINIEPLENTKINNVETITLDVNGVETTYNYNNDYYTYNWNGKLKQLTHFEKPVNLDIIINGYTYSGQPFKLFENLIFRPLWFSFDGLYRLAVNIYTIINFCVVW